MEQHGIDRQQRSAFALRLTGGVPVLSGPANGDKALSNLSIFDGY